MTRRCCGWDYRRRAIYQITLVQRDRRRSLLGRLEVRRGEGWVAIEAARELGLQPEEVEARVVLSELGEAILAHWLRIGEFTPEIKPLFCQIMPDHLHAILEVTRPMTKPLGNAIGGFKTGCEKLYRQLAERDRELALSAQNRELALSAQNRELALLKLDRAAEPAPNERGEAEMGFAGSVSAAPAAEGQRLWAEGFQDSILFRAGQLDNMFNYLRDNPRRLAIKRLFPNLFRVVGKLRVNLWLAPEARNKGLAPEPCSVPEAPAFGSSAPAFGSSAPAFGFFSALGNRFLLGRPLHQIQVSRRDFGYKREPKSSGQTSRGGGAAGGLKISRDGTGAPFAEFSTAVFAERRDAAFEAARRGTVLISPCVSDGEREIARQALEAKLPLVVLKNKGFSPLQKPAGRAFDACSDGRLLMLAPIAWPYVPGEKAMRREEALVMNRLAQLIAREGAAEINYHGAKPAHVDSLAAAAVRGDGLIEAALPGARRGGRGATALPGAVG